MTTEEKAKSYDKALEQAKKFHTPDSNNSNLKAVLELIFPELAESEDERIRKDIIDYLHLVGKGDGDYAQPMIDGWIAYLEKQKEQIPYIDFVIKPHKGDDNNPYDMSVSEAQDYAIKREFGIPFNDGEVYVDERHMTQTIGNILRWADEHPKEQKPAEWTLPKDFEEAVYKVANFISPFDSQDELRRVSHLFAKQLMSLAKKELVEKPAEWSEEDEKMLDSILAELANHICYNQPLKGVPSGTGWTSYKYQQEIDWLKSLCPHSQWKPSEDQLWAANRAMDFTLGTEDHDTLLSLFNDLKKLMEDQL